MVLKISLYRLDHPFTVNARTIMTKTRCLKPFWKKVNNLSYAYVLATICFVKEKKTVNIYNGYLYHPKHNGLIVCNANELMTSGKRFEHWGQYKLSLLFLNWQSYKKGITFGFEAANKVAIVITVHNIHQWAKESILYIRRILLYDSVN